MSSTESNTSWSDRGSTDLDEYIVPSLDLSKLKTLKKGDYRDFYSPVVTKSDYARHPPTPGVIVDISEACIARNMMQFAENKERDLADALNELTETKGSFKKDVVANNIRLYKMDRHYEYVFYDNRAQRVAKQNTRKQIDTEKWYIQKYEKELHNLKSEYSEIRAQNKLDKQSTYQLNREIKGLKVDLNDVVSRKDVRSLEKMKAQIQHIKEESASVGLENEKMNKQLIDLEKKLHKYQSQGQSPVSASGSSSSSGSSTTVILPQIGKKPQRKGNASKSSTTVIDRTTEPDLTNKRGSRVVAVSGKASVTKLSRIGQIEISNETLPGCVNADDTKVLKVKKKAKKHVKAPVEQKKRECADDHHFLLAAGPQKRVLPPIKPGRPLPSRPLPRCPTSMESGKRSRNKDAEIDQKGESKRLTLPPLV